MTLISFKENDISQKPALELLQKLGFQYISPEEAMEMRDGKTSNVLLEDVLRQQLRKLNSIRIGSRSEERFSEQNIENGVIALRNIPMDDGYLSANESVYNILTLGKAFEQSIDGDKKSYTMRYIDWQNPENNVYHVTEEFAVARTGSTDTYRPDIVLFVNGIPLVVIECKRPDIKGAEEQAISQHLRNQKEDGIRNLYVYSAILLAIGNSFGAYGTTATAAQFWCKWHELFINNDADISYHKLLFDIINSNAKKVREITLQDEYIYNLCRPERLLEL
ncbi:MAG: type I restriction endonuclease subunit R, partial [Bacteroidales bacterium]|nr:type I restriction endonuclease subunit R [Bacteroidales bacterium]